MTDRTSGAGAVAARTPEPWALLVGAVGVALLLAAVGAPAPVATHAVGPVLAAYRTAALDLPDRGPIAFVTTSDDPTTASAHQYLAQHALAPRLVVVSTDEVAAAVTEPGAPTRVDAILAAVGLRLVRVTAEGVRVYRR